ncbi:farnesol dehydrogenase-like [Photinus pyralis]|uniref:farnesol dehydrogenase-like n=1 Tax=Photinus pyralis TaxID=7054 RepID=UPI00126709BE|nr:farnesol dehydrogenase-like [Photinus pyralis]
MKEFEGKVAVVTGASSGIGSAIAQRLAEEGMIVAGLARNSGKVIEMAEQLGNKGQNIHAIATDVTKEDSVRKAFDYINKNLGVIHVLVNSAGISKFALLTKGSPDEWRAILDTNVVGLSIVTKEAIASMTANGVHGHIIHINSVLGHFHLNQHSGHFYEASKFAVTSLTESLRKELIEMKSGIKITSISPGIVDTPMLDTTLLGVEGAGEIIDAFKRTNPALHVNDVVDGIIYVLNTAPHVQVHELIMRPVGEQI